MGVMFKAYNDPQSCETDYFSKEVPLPLKDVSNMNSGLYYLRSFLKYVSIKLFFLKMMTTNFLLSID